LLERKEGGSIKNIINIKIKLFSRYKESERNKELDTRRSIRKVSLSDINPFEMSDCHGGEHEETICREVKA